MHLGWMGTTGCDFIQYVLSDPVLTPPHLRAGFSEKIIFMPHSFMACSHAVSRPLQSAGHDDDAQRRRALGLPTDGGFIFCNFGQMYKVEPQIWRVWMRLLLRVPHSVLWLLTFPEGE